MTFTKGQSGNPSGRPKGSPNKTPNELRLMIGDFLKENFQEVKTAFDSLDPEKKAKVYTDLLSYGLPKLTASALSVRFEDLTDEQLDELIGKLKRDAETETDGAE
jgi:hypothetical protein